jgi:autotransporter-associated beta strand protein
MTIPGKITGSDGSTGLIFNSGNTTNALTLSGANDFSNGFTLQVGRVNVQSTNAVGLGNLVFAVTGNGTLVNNGGVDVTLNNPLVNLQSGSIDVSANSGRRLTLTGKLTGPANWKKDNGGSTGTLELTNSTSDFTGSVNVVAGRLAITANNALGSAAGGTTINSGAALVMRGGFNYTTPEPLTIGGTGLLSDGAIHNVDGDNRFAGPVTLSATTTVGVTDGSLELAGPVTGAFQFQKSRAGTLVLSNAGNQFTSLAINAGVVVVSADGNLGAVPASPAVNNVTLGGTLRATSSFSMHANRGVNILGTTSAFDVAPGATLNVPGAVIGETLNKTGGGTLALTSATGHTGGTNISAGTLSLAVTGALAGDVNVLPGGALHGSGSVGGNVTVAGTVAPGHGPGTLATTGNHTWAAGGAYEFEIDDAAGTAGANWDQMTMNAITVSATSSNRFVIRVVALPGAGGPGLDNFDPDQPFSWAIAVAASGEVTSFDLTKFEIDLTQFEQNNQNKGGFYVSRGGFKGDLMLNYVPEPGAGLTLTLGTAALLRRRRRSFT